MTKKDSTLTPLYYHNHFMEMIEYITSFYIPLLNPEEIDFIECFKNLNTGAQCVFIRMLNRKKFAFLAEEMFYPEIDAPLDAIEELKKTIFVRSVKEDDYPHLLKTLNKNNLIALLQKNGIFHFKKSSSKQKFIDFIIIEIPYQKFRANYEDAYLIPELRNIFHFFLYLYFGKNFESLTTFTLRDLGMIAVNGRKHNTARFDSIAEARAGFFYTQTLNELKSADTRHFENIFKAIENFPPTITDFTLTLKNKLFLTLGRYFERQKNTDAALVIYKNATSSECNERQVRLLHTNGENENVKKLLEAMIENPANDDEYFFATDFFSRKFKQQKIGLYTESLRKSTPVIIDELYRGSPEMGVIHHYKKLGWECFHTENYLWTHLFGLVFWQELFEEEYALHNEFDMMPHALKEKTFHHRFLPHIAQKMEIAQKGGLLAMVQNSIATYKGRPNGIIGWHDNLESLMEKFLSAAPPVAVSKILRQMTEDFHAMKDGYPDLMLIKNNQIKFLEVKAEGDQIRRHQLSRMNQLKKAGFNIDIMRVEYKFDPDQTYVVLDVETTGGRPPWDRVTEIGAVKLRNNQIIGEWQSLINPQRSIPAMIIQLTGISNDMVKDAPLFADILAELTDFLDGSIFVAHNVNFDYGFISSEYNRLEQPFRYPKFCTCASMRKYYPGYASYGLASLAHAFSIPLRNHHRALADARVAAELLIVINEKRSLKSLSSLAA